MIRYCTALSRYCVRDMIKGHERKDRNLLDGYDNVAWIGIEPAGSALRRWPQPRQLLLEFDDVTLPEDGGPSTMWFPDGTRESYFSHKHAREIQVFVDGLHNDERNWALIVHCAMGISRSPAVALWVRERYRITVPEVPSVGTDANQWQPNRTVARVLRELGGGGTE